jgi:hypothetical protein
MSGKQKPEKQETDANDVIRDYEEVPAPAQEENQTAMEWYEQASQDTTVPPEAAITGGDIDAAWEQTASGEEAVGGSNPTPDQDLVDEIGRGAGVSYEDAEPLDMTRKIERRDEQRWELNPASSEDFAERSQSNDTTSSSEKPAARAPHAPESEQKRDRKAA